MRQTLIRVLCLCLLATATVPALANASSDAATRLHALFEQEWQRDLAENPLGATYIGDARYNDRWPDLSAEARARREAAYRAVLTALDGIARADLSVADQLNYDLFRYEYQDRVDALPFQRHLYDLSPRDGVQTLNETAEIMPFNSSADFETWLARLRALPTYLAQFEQQLRDAAKSGHTQPRVIMERILPQLDMQLVDRAEDSPFFKRFTDFPPAITESEQQRLAASARQVIGELVVPAYRQFATTFREVYLPACRETAGLWDTPEGKAHYANRVRHHTTTALAPEQIHQIGLEEVARNRAEMQLVMDEVKFTGSLTEFFHFLRTDEQFYYKTPDELFRAYVYASKMVEGELPKLFGRLYRTPFGLRVIPDTSAPNTTTAYYSGPSIDGKRSGYYYVNLYRPEVRPKYEIEVLSVHEAVPGHHLQIALAQEQAGLPKFRRFGGFTAYIEGWALYSERLGYDLGLYQDPYSRFGQLTYDQWRSVRLVVDTGIHHLGWTRQQAIDYFKANAAKTEADIINEIDRYIAWPGQALAYKIGQLRILELRARAKAELGDKFDIRDFHDTLLATGAVPLEVMEQTMNAWLAARKAP